MPREPIPIEGADSDPNAHTPAHPDPLNGNSAAGLDPDLTDMAVIEAMLDQLVTEQNVWEFIDRIENQYRIPPDQRQHFYERYITMVAQRPQAEQDALVARGQTVFRYRSDTARRDIQALRVSGGTSIKFAPGVLDTELMAEIIHCPNDPVSIKYLVYKTDGSTELSERLQIGPFTYMPPQTRLVDTNTLVLPSGIEEYGESIDLYRDVRAFISDYLYVENRQYRAIAAYYVLLSWLYDKFDVVPYLRAMGEYGTGKTRLLQVIGSLCFRTIFAGGATTASPIFRIMERFHGTLIIDEADFNDRSEVWSEITKILNTGYMRGFPVLRSERKGVNDQYDTETYDCYGPKILSTRRRFTDMALESRCLSHTMQLSAQMPVSIPLFLGPEFREAARTMRNKLLLWRFRRYRGAVADPRQRFQGLDPRLNQILIPLMAVADDDNLRRDILDHAQKYQLRMKEDQRDSWEGKVAFCTLRAWSKRAGDEDRILMKAINERITAEFGEKSDTDRTRRAVGNLIRHTFGLTTIHRGGMVWVQIAHDEARRLAERYSLPFEQFLPTPTAAQALSPEGPSHA